jgi:hypothetical protein
MKGSAPRQFVEGFEFPVDNPLFEIVPFLCINFRQSDPNLGSAVSTILHIMLFLMY